MSNLIDFDATPQQASPLAELVPVLYREGRRRAATLASLFALIALSALVIGMVWGRSYTSTATILVQDSDIIEPLLEGRAVATGVADRAGIARQVIYSRRVMDDVLEAGGWLAGNPSPVARDRLIDEIKARIRIDSPQPDLIQISYTDVDRQRTFVVADRLAELLISESRAAKEQESRAAFEFIDSQVREYQQKLTDAEQNLLKYRSDNPDAQPSSAVDATARIAALRTAVEQARMAAMEQSASVAALQSQLAGESQITAVQTRESLYRAQLVDLQSQLDQLLLSYTDQYPDVVRIRSQIRDLEQQLASDQRQQRTAPPRETAAMGFDNAQFNPHYQALRSRLGEAQQALAATRGRMSSAQTMLNEELERSDRIAVSESALEELTRDYDVHREIYQDLMRRRENARMSMTLDEQQRGLTLHIQDPAMLPLRPSGLRLMHFAAAGLLLGLAVPLGLLFTMVRFDPRVRSARQLERLTGLSVLASVPAYPGPSDRRRRRRRELVAAILVAAVLVAYGTMTWIRLMEAR